MLPAAGTVRHMILDRLEIGPDDLAARTGWHVEPEGACNGDVCVPLPASARLAGGAIAAPALAERLGAPLLHDPDHGLWALGPASVTGRALVSAEAPALTLPDLDGNPFELARLRGQKVLLVAWASW